MNELYWITRCDAIGVVFTVFLVLSSIFVIAYLVNYAVEADEDCRENTRKCAKSWRVKMCGYAKVFLFIFSLSILGKVFIPNTKEALLIYGVGGTIDYLKQNPTARQLPDK